MSSEEKPARQIKVTDKRLFTSDGDLRDEFKDSIKPSEGGVSHETEKRARPAEDKPPKSEPPEPKRPQSGRGEPSEAGDNPGTPFTMFLESLIVNAYMSLGMIRNPFQPDAPADLNAAKQMIEIISMLQKKTKGNLTPEEVRFLDTHLGELKLAFVRRGQAM